jgi:hypothetical protein
MSGGEQKGRAVGTDPKAAASDLQAETRSESGDQQRRDTMNRMSDSGNRDPATVERWFDRHLNKLYADVISEPLPREFLELIDKLREKTSK